MTFPDMAIFRGSVYHRRRQPHRYCFRQPLFMLFINADTFSTQIKKLGWLARLGLINCRRQDYLPHPTQSLAQTIREELYNCSGIRADGQVYMLVQPRQFGCAYNPAAFYFICDDTPAARAAHLLIEVHNTPWNERFCYAGHYTADSMYSHSEMQKQHRVSPFNPLAMTYQWHYTQPLDKFFIHIRCLHNEQLHFDAALMLRQLPFNRRQLVRALLSTPFSAAAGFVAIYWHALRLKLKNVPTYLR